MISGLNISLRTTMHVSSSGTSAFYSWQLMAASSFLAISLQRFFLRLLTKAANVSAAAADAAVVLHPSVVVKASPRWTDDAAGSCAELAIDIMS